MITVTKGQWFPLTISNIQYGGVDFDLQGATDVKAALISTTGVRAELESTISAFNELSAVCDGTIATGKYSVEVTAVGSDGKNYRMRSPLAARMHDEWYDTKGDGWARELDDLLFLCECLKVSKTPMQRFFAYLYFLLVRVFGWAFYRYDR